MSSLEEIKALEEKQNKIKAVLAKAVAQKEVAIEEKERLLEKLKTEFNINFEEIETVLADLREKQSKILAEIKDKLDKINL